MLAKSEAPEASVVVAGWSVGLTVELKRILVGDRNARGGAFAKQGLLIGPPDCLLAEIPDA